MWQMRICISHYSLVVRNISILFSCWDITSHRTSDSPYLQWFPTIGLTWLFYLSLTVVLLCLNNIIALYLNNLNNITPLLARSRATLLAPPSPNSPASPCYPRPARATHPFYPTARLRFYFPGSDADRTIVNMATFVNVDKVVTVAALGW